MATVEKLAEIIVDPEVQAAIDRALEGVRDPGSMRRAAERMDRMARRNASARRECESGRPADPRNPG